MITAPWHPILASDRAVYHNDTRCPEGAAIAVTYRRLGDGGRAPCEQCGRSGPDPLPSTGPAVPETRERLCPACRSGGITPLDHVIGEAGLIKVTYRCEACGQLFMFVPTPLA